ncbi:MAG: STAS domain-containing protein, partial [Gammaproteobacteria bacterium]|nr:STAS domain-containing protein [Gammaproteobacteria bacterium]
VLIGVLVKIIIHLFRGVPLKNLLKMSYDLQETSSGNYTIKIHGSAIFANFIGLKSQLAEIESGQHILFDVTEASYIDHTVMEFIEQFKQDYIDRGGRCTIEGLDVLSAYSDHSLAARRRL